MGRCYEVARCFLLCMSIALPNACIQIIDTPTVNTHIRGMSPYFSVHFSLSELHLQQIILVQAWLSGNTKPRAVSLVGQIGRLEAS